MSWRRHWKLALVAALVVAGLGLRLVPTERLPIDLDQWLPWVNPPTVTLYFPDDQERFLVPLTRRVASEDVTPEGAARELLQGPQDQGRLGPVFPDGAHVSRIEAQDGMALVEITTEPAAGADLEFDALAQQALVSTLKGFPGVESVRLMVNGTLVKEASATSVPKQDHPVYYTYGPYLVPVTVEASSPEEALVRYLEGPAPHLGSEIRNPKRRPERRPEFIEGLVEGSAIRNSQLEGLPADVRLLGYRFDTGRGLARVNFTYTDSVHQLALANPDGIRRTLIGIITTLTGFPEVKAVMLDFEGHAQLGLGQCSDLLRAPQVRPAVLNDERIAGF